MKSSLNSLLKLLIFLFFLVSSFALFTKPSQAQSQCLSGEVAFSCGYSIWPNPQYSELKEACFNKSIAQLKIQRSTIRFIGATGSGGNYQENYCAKQTTVTEITRVPVTTIQPSNTSIPTNTPTISPTTLEETPTVTVSPTFDFEDYFDDEQTQALRSSTGLDGLQLAICCCVCLLLLLGLIAFVAFLIRRNKVKDASQTSTVFEKPETKEEKVQDKKETHV